MDRIRRQTFASNRALFVDFDEGLSMYIAINGFVRVACLYCTEYKQKNCRSLVRRRKLICSYLSIRFFESYRNGRRIDPCDLETHRSGTGSRQGPVTQQKGRGSDKCREERSCFVHRYALSPLVVILGRIIDGAWVGLKTEWTRAASACGPSRN